MKLHSVDLSPYAARVRMQIYAKGMKDIAFEHPTDWGFPKFREKFPIGRIPVLETGGDRIPESAVISEYLEEIRPQPSLLGTTPIENAHIRALARIGEIYLTSNMFALSRQTGALSRRTPSAARGDAAAEQLVVEVQRNLKSLENLIGKEGYACGGRLTLADCALVPALFFVENILPVVGVDPPIPGLANVSAYWDSIQKNEHAAKVLVELHRGVEERRDRIRDGSLDQLRAAITAAWAEANARSH